jgi:hypothetical protein
MMHLCPACPACGSLDVLYTSSFIGGLRECRYQCFSCGYQTPDCETPCDADVFVEWVEPAAAPVLDMRVEAQPCPTC